MKEHLTEPFCSGNTKFFSVIVMRYTIKMTIKKFLANTFVMWIQGTKLF